MANTFVLSLYFYHNLLHGLMYLYKSNKIPTVGNFLHTSSKCYIKGDKIWQVWQWSEY